MFSGCNLTFYDTGYQLDIITGYMQTVIVDQTPTHPCSQDVTNSANCYPRIKTDHMTYQELCH